MPAERHHKGDDITGVLPESYAAFIGSTSQTNGPPGGLATVTAWIRRSGIGSGSTVLDLACSSGFSGRTVHCLTGCRVVGLDVDESAVRSAQRAIQAQPNNRASVAYLRADAHHLPIRASSCSHVIAGCSFGFLSSPSLALSECTRVLRRGGYLCVAIVFPTTAIPGPVLDAAAQVIGYRPGTQIGPDRWQRLFSQELRLVHTEYRSFRRLTDADVARQCVAHIGTFMRASEYRAALARMYFDRLVIRELNRFQAFRVEVYQRGCS